MKRLEIILGTYELKKVVDILEEKGALGYTVISDAAGRGRHSKKIKDEITEVNRRSVVIYIDEEEKIKSVVEELKPLKDRYSLKAFLSDVSMEL